MKIRINAYSVTNILCFLYIFATMVWSSMPSTRLLYYICALLFGIALSLDMLRHKFILHTNGFAKSMFIFLFFCFWSSLFAVDTSVSLSITGNMLINIMFTALIANYTIRNNQLHALMKAYALAGVCMTLYLFLSEGVQDVFSSMLGGSRIGGAIGNENAIGIYAAITSVLATYYVKQERIKLWSLALPCCAIIALGSGSRMALILMIIGIFLVFCIDISAKKIVPIALSIIIFTIAIIYLLSRPEFSVISQRIMDLFNLVFTGTTNNKSMNYRMIMITEGLRQFLSSPFVGVGIGNSGSLVSGLIDNTHYLHNNYVELLSGVGILGFISYYSIYAAKLIHVFRARKAGFTYASITGILLIMLLINDISNVTYYKQEIYLLLMFSFCLDASNVEKEWKDSDEK